jgi:hypothetical protein
MKMSNVRPNDECLKRGGNRMSYKSSLTPFLSESDPISVSFRHFFSMRSILKFAPLVAVLLTACIWLPVEKDDFAVLGNDVFSNLIKDSYGRLYINDRGLVVAYTGYGRIDKTKALEIARINMRGKTAQEVIEIFEHDGGSCKKIPLVITLNCEVTRKWKLKITGAPFDSRTKVANSKLDVPGVKLLYRFVLTESNVVDDLELNLVDATEFKK